MFRQRKFPTEAPEGTPFPLWLKANEKYVRDWVDAGMSQGARDYRVRALATAFGIREDVLRKFLDPNTPSGFGYMLVLELMEWCADFPDISENNPITPDDYTPFHDMDLDGGT